MKKTVFLAAALCLMCLHAAPAPAQAPLGDNISKYRNDFIFLTPVHMTQSVSFQLVNTLLNDLTEFHVFWFLTSGPGNVCLSVSPAAGGQYEDLQYGLFGQLGPIPLGILTDSSPPQLEYTGSNGDPILVIAPVLGSIFGRFSLGVIFLAITKATGPTDLPVVMTMNAGFDQTEGLEVCQGILLSGF